MAVCIYGGCCGGGGAAEVEDGERVLERERGVREGRLEKGRGDKGRAREWGENLDR